MTMGHYYLYRHVDSLTEKLRETLLCWSCRKWGFKMVGCFFSSIYIFYWFFLFLFILSFHDCSWFILLFVGFSEFCLNFFSWVFFIFFFFKFRLLFFFSPLPSPKKILVCFFLYWCFYLLQSRDLVSPVCGIIFFNHNCCSLLTWTYHWYPLVSCLPFISGPNKGRPTPRFLIFVLRASVRLSVHASACPSVSPLVRLHYMQKTLTRPLYLGNPIFLQIWTSYKVTKRGAD